MSTFSYDDIIFRIRKSFNYIDQKRFHIWFRNPIHSFPVFTKCLSIEWLENTTKCATHYAANLTVLCIILLHVNMLKKWLVKESFRRIDKYTKKPCCVFVYVQAVLMACLGKNWVKVSVVVHEQIGTCFLHSKSRCESEWL